MEPLTAEEANFAAERHELIIHFLSSRHLPEADYYDVAALGFLRAVKNWFSRPELHQYAFSTIAWNAMRSNIGNYRLSYKRRKRHEAFSLNDLLPGAKSLTFADTIQDPHISIEDRICIRETLSETLGGGQLVA
jgi:hypothetical protein